MKKLNLVETRLFPKIAPIFKHLFDLLIKGEALWNFLPKAPNRALWAGCVFMARDDLDIEIEKLSSDIY